MLLVLFTLLALSGAVWLRRGVAAHVDAHRDAAEKQARFSVTMAWWLAAGVALLPLSVAVVVVPMMLFVVFAQSFGGTAHLFARLLAFVLALALGLMGFQAHSPQRFDRLDVTIPQARGSAPIEVRVALLGTRGGAYLVGACDRVRYPYLGATLWKSSRPVELRFPMDVARDAEIVSRRYAFAQPDETSILGALLSTVAGLDAPSIAASLSAGVGQRDVCGGVDGSATKARRAVRALVVASSCAPDSLWYAAPRARSSAPPPKSVGSARQPGGCGSNASDT